jgi:hypothetical protein
MIVKSHVPKVPLLNPTNGKKKIMQCFFAYNYYLNLEKGSNFPKHQG